MTREEYEELKNSKLYKTESEKITNQKNLLTLTAEEFYDKIMWLLHDYGKRYTDSRIAIVEWLDSEVENEQTKR